MLSRSYSYDREIDKWTWADSYFFCSFFNHIFFFIPSTLNCLMIELHDFIKFAFKHGYLGIMTGLEILRLDLGGLKSTFFNLFLIIFFFLNFCPLTFYLINIKLHTHFLFVFLFMELSHFIWFIRNWHWNIFLFSFLCNYPNLISMVVEFVI